MICKIAPNGILLAEWRVIEARKYQPLRILKREQIFNNRTKPSMFYIACCA